MVENNLRILLTYNPDTVLLTPVKIAFQKFHYALVPNADKIRNGATIRAARKKKNMPLRELARKLDLAAPYLSDLERGNRSFSEDLFNRAKAAILRFRQNGK